MRAILGTEFRFVRCKPEHQFGATEHWAEKTEKVAVSDLERTIIDGLKQPAYCGGFSEVAKGYWIRRADMNVRRLVDYALRLASVITSKAAIGDRVKTGHTGSDRDQFI